MAGLVGDRSQLLSVIAHTLCWRCSQGAFASKAPFVVSAPCWPREQRNPGVGTAAGQLCPRAVDFSLSRPGLTLPRGLAWPRALRCCERCSLGWTLWARGRGSPYGEVGRLRSSSTSKTSGWLAWLVFLAFLFPPFPVGFAGCPEALAW